MPTRFIRDSCLTSPNLNAVSDGAERLFWRLVTVADDFGRFEADPRIIAGRCYPLRTSAGICKQMTAYVSELVKYQLIQCYTVNDRVYGVFITWGKHQRTRARHSKYPPQPADICGHLLSNAADLRPSTFDLRPSINPTSDTPNGKAAYGELGNVWLTEPEYTKLAAKLGQDLTDSLIQELDHGIASKGYKYKSHYATILNWARRRPAPTKPLRIGLQEGVILE